MPPRYQSFSSSCLKSRRREPRPLLQHHDRESGLRQLPRNDAARRAGADDDEVDGVGVPIRLRAHLTCRRVDRRSRDSRDRSSRTAAGRHGASSNPISFQPTPSRLPPYAGRENMPRSVSSRVVSKNGVWSTALQILDLLLGRERRERCGGRDAVRETPPETRRAARDSRRRAARETSRAPGR